MREPRGHMSRLSYSFVLLGLVVGVMAGALGVKAYGACGAARSALQDMSSVQDPRLNQVARSVGMLIDARYLGHTGSEPIDLLAGRVAGRGALEPAVSFGNTVSLRAAPLGAVSLSHGEDEERGVSSGLCTGFLVAPDIVATAGHCLRKVACQDARFVFGWTSPAAAQVSPRNVYSCKEVIALSDPGLNVDIRVQNEPQISQPDYALLRLGRKVAGREPLRVQADASNTRAVLMLGHPYKMAMKVSSGVLAGVMPTGSGSVFLSHLESYQGNSGSPVLDADSLEVLGIAFFRQKGSCPSSSDCHGGCTRSTNISVVLKHLER